MNCKTKFTLILSVLLAWSSFPNSAHSQQSAAADDDSPKLPRGPISIGGEANQGANYALTCFYGRHEKTAPGESSIGLMNILVLPPSGDGWQHSRRDPAPNTFRYQFDREAAGNRPRETVQVTIKYDPEKREIEVANAPYSVAKGNFFLISIINKTNVAVQQFAKVDFNYTRPPRALGMFKRLSTDNRVRKLK